MKPINYGIIVFIRLVYILLTIYTIVLFCYYSDIFGKCDNTLFLFTLSNLIQNTALVSVYFYITMYERMYIFPLIIYFIKIFIYKYPSWMQYFEFNDVCYREYPLLLDLKHYDIILCGISLFAHNIVLVYELIPQNSNESTDINYRFF
jgi:hypothetical protein